MSNQPINDGGPAYPFAATDPSNVQMQAPGMSLRDHFAGLAMPTAWAIVNANDRDARLVDVAAWAYRMADAMLAERAKAGAK